VHVNHRGVFNAFLAHLGLGAQSEEVLRAIDKLGKIGPDETATLLKGITGSSEKAAAILAYGAPKGSFDATLANMGRLAGDAPEAVEGIARLRGLWGLLSELGVGAAFVLDPSITRGLDYYTGLVYETFLSGAEDLGSVCSGGRYDNLAALYMKERLPGVGASIGLDRLMAALEKIGAPGAAPAATDLVVFCQDSARFAEYHRAAAFFRSRGLAAEVFPEAKKMGAQYQWAEKKAARDGLLLGADGTATVKNLATREAVEGVTLEAAAEMVGGVKVELAPVGVLA
jgi:histidyl-tRNA synthetase